MGVGITRALCALTRRKPLQRSGLSRKSFNGFQNRRRIRRQSRAARKRQAEWNKITRAAIDDVDGACQAHIPHICLGRATQGHHLKSRGQGGEYTRKNCLPVCAACQTYIHEHPAWAYSAGLLIPRNQPSMEAF